MGCKGGRGAYSGHGALRKTWDVRGKQKLLVKEATARGIDSPRRSRKSAVDLPILGSVELGTQLEAALSDPAVPTAWSHLNPHFPPQSPRGPQPPGTSMPRPFQTLRSSSCGSAGKSTETYISTSWRVQVAGRLRRPRCGWTWTGPEGGEAPSSWPFVSLLATSSACEPVSRARVTGASVVETVHLGWQ